MAPDDLQQAWQAHSPQMRVKIYDELMLKELQRDLRRRQTVPFWISCILLGTAVLMLFAYWNYAPPQLAFPWYYDPFYWIIGWLFASSLLGLRRSLSQGSDIPESLLDCLKRSLNHVDRELAWTRRSWKWMLLATVLSCAFFYLIGGATAFPVMATTVLIMAFDYFVIQFVGRVSSDFQRQKLLPLYSSLTDEPYRSQELIVSTSDSNLEWLMPFVFSVAGCLLYTSPSPRDRG